MTATAVDPEGNQVGLVRSLGSFEQTISGFEVGGDCRWSNGSVPCWTADCDGDESRFVILATGHLSCVGGDVDDAPAEIHLASSTDGLPAEVFEENAPPTLAALNVSLSRFDAVAAEPAYRALTERAEFQATHQLLRQ